MAVILPMLLSVIGKYRLLANCSSNIFNQKNYNQLYISSKITTRYTFQCMTDNVGFLSEVGSNKTLRMMINFNRFFMGRPNILTAASVGQFYGLEEKSQGRNTSRYDLVPTAGSNFLLYGLT